MKKPHLLTPGPTPVPPEILLAMARPLIHHRESEFRQVVEQCRAGLMALFQTERDVLILTSSGTGAMEAAVTNFLSRGDKALYVNGGKFGERWGRILSAYGCSAVEVSVPWGSAVDPEAIRRQLDADSSIRAVYLQATETSTTVRHPVEAIAAITRERPGVLLVVDGITAVGAFDLPMDRLGIDVLLTGSQKALMLPPGLAFIAWSAKADTYLERSDLPVFYFDLARERARQQGLQTAWTPAISLVVGLRDVLARLQRETLPQVFSRTAKLAAATRAGVKALGLGLLAPDHPSETCTAVLLPNGVDADAVKKTLRDKFGVVVASGQDSYQGRILRIAHMGYCDESDVITAICTLEFALRKAGHPVSLGLGIRAVLEVLGASCVRYIAE